MGDWVCTKIVKQPTHKVLKWEEWHKANLFDCKSRCMENRKENEEQ